MRLDRTVRFIVEVVLRDPEEYVAGGLDRVIRDTQRHIQLTGGILNEVRDETFKVNFVGVIATKEVPK